MSITKKTVQLVLLPTEDISPLAYVVKNLEFDKQGFDPHVVNTQHLYLISDDESSNGWNYFQSNNGLISIVTDKRVKTIGTYKKVIASTNSSLNLPRIPKSFLKVYVKTHSSNTIKEVQVEYETKTLMKPTDVYNETVTYIKTRKDKTVVIHKISQKILEKDGHKYSRKEFSGYKFRAIAEMVVKGEEYHTRMDIYTTCGSMDEILKTLEGIKTDKVESIQVVYITTKEQDEATTKFLLEDMWLNS